MEQDEFRSCPFCRERIRAAAIKCRYCGEWFTTQAGLDAHLSDSVPKLFRELAERGNIGAQNSLGCCYWSGKGLPRDAVKAVELFRQAAEAGLAEAQVNLGLAYAEGRGVKKDLVEAARWYRRSAERGFPDGQHRLAMAYAEGNGVPRDSSQAVKWYRRAAGQGFALAQYSLGTMYMRGEGVPKDLVEAYKWFILALKGGSVDAAARQDELAREMKPDEIPQAWRLAEMFERQ